MKKSKILNSIKTLIDCEYSECFIPVEKANMIFIDYEFIDCNLYSAYVISKQFATMFNSEIIFRYGNADILMDKNTKMDDIRNQYKIQSKIFYELFMKYEIDKAIECIDVKRINELMMDEKIRNKYISDSQLRKLSQTLCNTYKITQSDPYLDNMVEDAKILIKK